MTNRQIDRSTAQSPPTGHSCTEVSLFSAGYPLHLSDAQPRSPRPVFLFAAVALGSFAPSAAFAQCDPAWETAIGDPGVSATVYSLISADEASAIGPALYVGGQFNTAGGQAAKNIARWDGTSWAALGTGAENGGIVYAMAVSDDGLLYVGGAFGNMGGLPGTNRIAKWDGSAWSDVGGGMAENNTGIRSLAFFGGDLYAGGFLNEIGGGTAHKIARWDGDTWMALPGDPLDLTDSVLALAAFDDGTGQSLYVGGIFSDAGGDTDARNVFAWDGLAITPLGQGANDDVEALAVWNGALYVGGQFTRVYQADGTEVIANKIAKWTGSEWQPLGDGMDTPLSSHVWALAAFDDGTYAALCAGGSFQTAGGVARRYVAAWDGTAWSTVGAANLNGYVYTLNVSNDDGILTLGGTFTTSGTPSANRVVQWAAPRPHTPTNAMADPPVIPFGDSTDLTATVPGATIHWYSDGCGSTLIGSGASITVTPTETTTYFARAFDGTCSSYACDTATVTVEGCEPPVILSDPTDATVCEGDSHEFCVAAQGTGTLHYQWRRGTVTLIGATSPCYIATQPGLYSCVVTDDCGTSVSEPALLTVRSPSTGDFDGDGLADLPDLVMLVNCLAGPGGGIQSACTCIDTDDDGAVDLCDFAYFQTVFAP